MNQQQLVEENMNLVYFTIHKFYSYLAKDEDIIQVGMIGLCNAVKSFDESKSAFGNYAVCCIRNAINYELRKRKKQIPTLSLEYEVLDANGKADNLIDLLVGEEDIPYMDLNGFYSQLDSLEKEIYQLRQEGMSVTDVAKTLKVSRDTVYQRMRKMKLKWRNTNGD